MPQLMSVILRRKTNHIGMKKLEYRWIKCIERIWDRLY